jgi:hypothetical protein
LRHPRTARGAVGAGGATSHRGATPPARRRGAERKPTAGAVTIFRTPLSSRPAAHVAEGRGAGDPPSEANRRRRRSASLSARAWQLTP